MKRVKDSGLSIYPFEIVPEAQAISKSLAGSAEYVLFGDVEVYL